MNEKEKFPYISIILLNWNNTNETLECLSSLQGVSYPNFDVVIVDNGSFDNSLERLEKIRRDISEFKITILKNKENLGFSGGNNTGMKYALSRDADYILVLNNDTAVDSKFLSTLVAEAAREKDVGVFVPSVYFYYEPHLIWFGGNTNVSWSKMDKSITCDLFNREITKKPFASNINFVTGCAMFIRANALREVGDFDDRFFLYFEDADLSFRFSDRGWKLRWVPQSKIWHKVSVTTLGQIGSPRVHYYNMRNILLLSKKHGPKWMMFYRPAWSSYTVGKQAAKILIGRNREVSKYIAKGIIHYWIGRYGKHAGK